MAGKEEENYLDKLLGSVGVEGLNVEEPKSIFGDRDDSDYDKAEVIEALTDINDPNGDLVKSVEKEPETVEENTETDVTETSNTIDDNKISEKSENANASEDAVYSEAVPDFSDPELSEGDLARLASMDLDTIIEDVSSDTFSVEDLFGEAGIDGIKLDPLMTESSAEKNDTNEGKGEKETVGEADTSSVDNENSAQTVESEAQALETAAVAAAAAAAVGNGEPEEEPGKKKKKKKSIGQIIKNIFFESVEETPEASKAKKDGKKASTKDKTDAKETVRQEINAGAGGEEELDENQRLIYEMYGKGNGEEETSAPKKGFFSKIKYRLQQMLKKSAEEDKLEQEAEDREYEEKQKIKAEKKEADKVKKEEAKQAKKEKKESKAAKKAEKPKKEKKPKPQPSPGDILKIKPQSMLMFVLFVTGAIILINMLNSTVSYNKSVAVARYNMENGNYDKVYEALSGLKLHKEEQSLYDQASAIMYVQRQYDSYTNYSSLGMHTEAINALIKGLERYNLYYDKAAGLGVDKQVDDVRSEIIKKLEEDYKISEVEAEKLLVMSEENFTQYYSKIEAYGKAVK